ncbi:MAG: DUF309 domain-containing protein [Planctomyces sp.]|nr:DUF309 domain-containing protein [Planctomyces sp.]
MTTDARLDEARRLFNDKEFFACHDVLEEVWSETLDEDRSLYQGLIHAAVALHHFSEGNLGGARKMYDSTVGYLAPHAERPTLFDVRRLMRDLEACFQELLSARDYPAGLSLRDDRIPRLHWTEPQGDG